MWETSKARYLQIVQTAKRARREEADCTDVKVHLGHAAHVEAISIFFLENPEM